MDWLAIASCVVLGAVVCSPMAAQNPGSFQSAVVYPSNQAGSDMSVVADFTNDGKPDVLNFGLCLSGLAR